MTKPIQIKREDVTQRVRDAAAAADMSITDVVDEGARLVLERAQNRSEREVADRLAAVRRIVEEFAALPKTGETLTDEDLYDEDGFPK